MLLKRSYFSNLGVMRGKKSYALEMVKLVIRL
jgi:hypothetical protein